MIESIADRDRYVSERLARLSWHTGGSIAPIEPEAQVPILFRDVGTRAMLRFLRGSLERLAGPMTPLLYLRTHEWTEPYEDHGRIGRLVFLRPALAHPWRSGVPHVFVARSETRVDRRTLAWSPGSRPLETIEARARDVADADAFREALGGAELDEERRDTIDRLERLVDEESRTERVLEPLRRDFQSADSARRDRARSTLRDWELGEDALCRAWHHLPAAIRTHVLEVTR
ncbi:MAG: hypothetical protein HY791_09835 [Deltaproteobacteria bacterium]|nr:hypothetical protein [Deltaproteobacteria bacterium]